MATDSLQEYLGQKHIFLWSPVLRTYFFLHLRTLRSFFLFFFLDKLHPVWLISLTADFAIILAFLSFYWLFVFVVF